MWSCSSILFVSWVNQCVALQQFSRLLLCMQTDIRYTWCAQDSLSFMHKGTCMLWYSDLVTACLGLARTIYTLRIRPYIWCVPWQKYHMHTILWSMSIQPYEYNTNYKASALWRSFGTSKGRWPILPVQSLTNKLVKFPSTCAPPIYLLPTSCQLVVYMHVRMCLQFVNTFGFVTLLPHRLFYFCCIWPRKPAIRAFLPTTCLTLSLITYACAAKWPAECRAALGVEAYGCEMERCKAGSKGVYVCVYVCVCVSVGGDVGMTLCMCVFVRIYVRERNNSCMRVFCLTFPQSSSFG